MKTFIYGIFDPITKELRYIGQTSKGTTRFKRHIKAAQHKKQPIACYIKSLLSKNLNPIFEVIEEVSVDLLDETEKFYIAYFRFLGCRLLNLTEGGKTTRGYKMPKEIVERVRKKSIGRPSKKRGTKLPHYQVEILREKGKTYIGENNPFFGKNHTSESKLLMSLSKKGRPAKNNKPIICLNNNVIYSSSYDAALKLNLKPSSIRSVLQGKAKSIKGFFFKYQEVKNV